jgi:xylulokinase
VTTPNSVVGLGLIQEGMVAISLGTSDTYFGTMAACKTDPRGEGHVFVSPTGDYMSLICFKNGSLARKAIKNQFHLTWDSFSQALKASPPGNNGKILLPFFETEIVPRVATPGIHRFDLEKSDGEGHCRAVVEAQMMSMRLHANWMGISPSAIYATGGASVNTEILQVMADVHNCPVHQFKVTNSAALGAALRAAHAYGSGSGSSRTWSDVVAGFAEPEPDSVIAPQNAAVYGDLMKKYADCEKTAIGA